MAKVRADQMLVDRGLAESRTRAQALILAGVVYVGDRKVDKAGQQLSEDAVLDVRGRDHPWVSRGGIKLAHGLAHFGWDVTGAVAIDVGSSTGGFTDVLLTNGAAKVFAVDSGTNQLAWKLRQDPRVVVHEQTSARIILGLIERPSHRNPTRSSAVRTVPFGTVVTKNANFITFLSVGGYAQHLEPDTSSVQGGLCLITNLLAISPASHRDSA